MEHDPSAIADGLRRRGVELQPRVPYAEWVRFHDAVSLINLDSLKSLYENFDGFQHADPASQISLWSLGKILDHKKNVISTLDNDYLIFGDLILESDYFGIRSISGAEEVWLIGENRMVASNIIELAYQIMTGRFDFL